MSSSEPRPRRKKRRLDERLVELGLESSRTRAQARIRAGEVRLGDRVLDKPGTLIAPDVVPVLREGSPFVSRGGGKLAGALTALQVDPVGLRCVDVGASTGGFTDCLLQRGAESILAIDVGRALLHERIRSDPRVRSLERTNVRHFSLPEGEPRFDLLTADLSFISLRIVLPKLLELVHPGGRLLLLVKPQFELSAREVGKGGVVREPERRERAVSQVREAAESLGLLPLGEVESELRGPKGNRERFLLLLRPQGPTPQKPPLPGCSRAQGA